MQMDAKTIWWLAIISGALQGLTSISWASFDINPHWLTAGAQVISYAQSMILLIVGLSGAKMPPVTLPKTPGIATIALLIGAGLLAMLLVPSNAHAQTTKKPLQITGNVISDLKANAASTTTPSQNVIAIYEKLQAVSLVDLKYALNIATKKNNMAASQCWTAIITQIEQDQTANLDANGQPIPTPDPHLFTDVERLSDVINSLGPNSPLMVGCGSFANQAKMNVLQLISAILAGGAGLAAFAP